MALSLENIMGKLHLWLGEQSALARVEQGPLSSALPLADAGHSPPRITSLDIVFRVNISTSMGCVDSNLQRRHRRRTNHMKGGC
jgi:hypothetical protein